jgi:hypothetical protein
MNGADSPPKYPESGEGGNELQTRLSCRSRLFLKFNVRCFVGRPAGYQEILTGLTEGICVISLDVKGIGCTSSLAGLIPTDYGRPIRLQQRPFAAHSETKGEQRRAEQPQSSRFRRCYRTDISYDHALLIIVRIEFQRG